MSPAITKYFTLAASILSFGWPISRFSHLMNLLKTSFWKCVLPMWTSAIRAAHSGISDLLGEWLGMSGQMKSLAISKSCLYLTASTQITWSSSTLSPFLIGSPSEAITVMESSSSSRSIKRRRPVALLLVTIPTTFSLDFRGIWRALPILMESLVSILRRSIPSILLKRLRK